MRISIRSPLEFAREGGYAYAALISALSARFERDPSPLWQVDWGLDSLPARRSEATAFWIDAYNAAAITGVVRNWPLHSVMDIRGYFSDPRYDVFGDTINTASRMETMSVPMRINVSETTWALVQEDFSFVEREPAEVKGKGAMRMYFVEA